MKNGTTRCRARIGKPAAARFFYRLQEIGDGVTDDSVTTWPPAHFNHLLSTQIHHHGISDFITRESGAQIGRGAGAGLISVRIPESDGPLLGYVEVVDLGIRDGKMLRALLGLFRALFTVALQASRPMSFPQGADPLVSCSHHPIA